MSNSGKNTDNQEEILLKLYHDKVAEVLKLKELNDRLLDANHNLLTRNIQFCRKNNIPVDIETMALVAEIRNTLQKMHSSTTNSATPRDNTQQGNTTTLLVVLS